jgi:FKBP-type peptidyl-prolyl cis-trans isomerase
MNRQTMQQIRDQGAAAAVALKASHDQFQREQTQRFATFQEQYAEQQAGYDKHNHQWEADELRKQRSAADFIEVIKGTRTVYDRTTGESATANLYYVDGVVDSLNQAALDPNRFVQIPLRDELHPLPAR